MIKNFLILFLIMFTGLAFADHPPTPSKDPAKICKAKGGDWYKGKCIYPENYARYRCPDGTWSQFGKCPPEKEIRITKRKCYPDCGLPVFVVDLCTNKDCSYKKPPKTPEQECIDAGGVYLGNGECRTTWPAPNKEKPVDNSIANIIKTILT